MSTNDDTLLTVQGLRSDDSTQSNWVNVPAAWDISSGLNLKQPAPGNSNTWKLSPENPGTGTIHVSIPESDSTLPDSLHVVFTRGAPVSASIDILTPPDKIIAGQPIQVKVSIMNKDGLVPGYFCFSPDSSTGQVNYQDTLGNGGRKDTASIIIDGVKVPLTQRPDNSSLTSQCFENGVDTMTMTLFYAPSSPDSAHEIFAALGNLATIKSAPFTLNPAALDSLALEYADGAPLGDSVSIKYPLGTLMLVAIGFDKYGNSRGPELSDWTTTQKLHPIDNPVLGIAQIYYDASTVKDDEYGYIRAVASDTSIHVSDSVWVTIKGPGIQLLSATTQDSNGNGYLDHIILRFSKSVKLDSGFISSNQLSIKYGSTVFQVDSMYGLGRTDSVWVLALKENPTTLPGTLDSIPQTAWRPFVTIKNEDSLNIDDVVNLVSLDGAGPVIWSVTKQIKGTSKDRTSDKVTVVFSEPIQQSDGSSLTPADAPSVLFYVWQRDSANGSSFTKVDSMIAGISNLSDVPSDSVVVFLTSNGRDLNASDYFSINTDKMFITDKVLSGQDNTPNLDNQRVQVRVTGAPSENLNSYPDPGTSTFSRVSPGI